MNRFENMHPGLDIDHIDNADQRLWHRLERVQMLSGRLLRAEGGRLSRGRDASRGQGRVLKALALVPEISQKDLMVLLDMRQQSLAELLAKLEAKGLVERPNQKKKASLRARLRCIGAFGGYAVFLRRRSASLM